MSNFLAIAAATATLRQILDDAVQEDVPGAVATMVRPDAPANTLPNPGVNAYLYQVGHNAAWRNADIPTRQADGRLMQRPCVAIDLHYLLTFHGNDGALEPQRVLGSAVRALHDQPLLTRSMIRSVINAAVLQDPQHFLAPADLDSEVELVKFTPLLLSLEELSKLWSVFFQTTYMLSIAYQGTVVLIESVRTPQRALPVRKRALHVLQFRQPRIVQIRAALGLHLPITAGDTVQILGEELRGESTEVRIDDLTVAPPVAQVADEEIRLALPNTLRAGAHSLQVIHPQTMGAPPVAHSGVESNAVPFMLQPTIAPPAVSNVAPARDANGSQVVVEGVVLQSAQVRVNFTPAVGRDQRTSLLLNELSPPAGRPGRAYQFAAPAQNGIAAPNQTETDVIDFDVHRLFPGQYLARVQVDGAESPLAVDAAGLYNAPLITI